MDLKLEYRSSSQGGQPQVGNPLSYGNFQNYESFYAEVYRQLFQSLFSYGMQICGNKELVKDCIQELFSELWNNQKTLVKVKSVKPYLLKCIKRKIKRALGKGRQLSVEGKFEFEISPETKFINLQQQDKNRVLLNRSLQSLTERQREAIYLRFYGNLSYEDIAEVLNIKTKATYKLISRALKKLKAVIKPSI